MLCVRRGGSGRGDVGSSGALKVDGPVVAEFEVADILTQIRSHILQDVGSWVHRLECAEWTTPLGRQVQVQIQVEVESRW